jgi:hypothetical protein
MGRRRGPRRIRRARRQQRVERRLAVARERLRQPQRRVDDGVEHEPSHCLGMAPQQLERDPRPIRHRDDVPARDAEGTPDGVQILDRQVSAEVAQVAVRQPLQPFAAGGEAGALARRVDQLGQRRGRRRRLAVQRRAVPGPALAHTYIAEKFVVKVADVIVTERRWIGREIKDAENELWIYFEIPLPAGIEGTGIRHGVLFDVYRDQLNSVLVRDADRKTTLVFLPAHGMKTVRFRP